MITTYTTGLQHIGMPTKDIQASKAFYEKLGFKVVESKDIVVDEEAIEVVFLMLHQLVLEFYSANSEAMSYEAGQGAVNHIAIDSNNVAELFQLLKREGYHMLDEDLTTLPFYQNGVRFFRILGPNSEIIEFNEIL